MKTAEEGEGEMPVAAAVQQESAAGHWESVATMPAVPVVPNPVVTLSIPPTLDVHAVYQSWNPVKLSNG